MATIVLVCANGASLTAGDTLIRDELQAAGHTVVPVSDDDPEYTGTYDGVVVSDSSSGGTVGSKYDTVAKPGVTFENVQWRLGTPVGAGSAITQWTVTATPELSAGLAGAVTVYDAAGQTQQGLDVESLPGGAQVIATDQTDPDKATYVAYEAGSDLTSGTAPARRVFLRVGDGALDNLTEDGLALLDAALDWSFGDPGGAAPTVDVGADVPSWPAGTEFERSAAVDDHGVAVTSQEWVITAGPTGVGTTIGTSDTLLWTPTTPGTYTLQFTATNGDGSDSDSLDITVVDGGTPAGYPSIVQSAQVISDTFPSSSAEGTLPAAATAGNLLVFCLAGDKDTGALAVSDNMSPSTEWNYETSLTSDSVSLYIAWKVALGGEVDIGADTTLPAQSGDTGWVVELAQDGTSAWGVLAKAQTLTDETEVSSVSTGTTGEATFDGLAVAVATVDSIDSISAGTQAWTNGYTLRNTPPPGGAPGSGGGSAGCYTATNTVDQGATTETAFSTTSGEDQMSGAVVVFGREGTVAETPPGAVFDLSNWKLQLPTGPAQGDVDEIEQPALDTYSDENFFLNASNEMVGIAPVVGVTTSDESGATRCELREMEGGVEAAWDPATTDLRQLTVTMRPDPTGASPRQEMIVAQIHGVSGTPPVYAAAEYHVTEPRIRIFQGNPNDGRANILTGITTADDITIRFRVENATLDVFAAIGGVDALPADPQLSWPVSDFSDNTDWYCKTLTYNKSQIDDADAGGESINTISHLELIQPGSAATGALDATLPLPTAQLTGTVASSGALDATLPVPGADLSGATSGAGALDSVLPLPVSAITGTTAATGALDSTLPTPTADLAGTVEGTGALDGNLPALTGALTGTAPVGGVLDGNLRLPVADLVAAAGTSGALDATLPAVTAALTGTAPVGGALAAVLPLPVADLAATTEGTATLDATLPLPIAAVSGTVTGTGQLDSALPLLAANLTASDIIDGGLDTVLPELSATLTGTVTDTGPVDATLPGLRADLAATVTTTGELDAALPLAVADLRGRVTAESGVLDGSLPVPMADLDGTATTGGALDGALPLPVMDLAGISGGEATLDAALPALVAAFTGSAPVGGALAAALPSPTAALGGVVAENEIDAALPLPVAAFTTHLTVPGELAATLPLLTADLRTLPPPSYTPPLHAGQPRWGAGYRSGDPIDGRAA